MYLRTRLPDNKRVYLLAKGVAASCTRQPSSFVRQRLAVAPRFSSLQETMSAFLEERVLSVHHWTDRLFSFTTTRDTALRFSNGHFTMIGLKVDGKPCCAPTPSPAPTTKSTWSSCPSRCPTAR
jgi:ferredoxin--NADP+ reductase